MRIERIGIMVLLLVSLMVPNLLYAQEKKDVEEIRERLIKIEERMATKDDIAKIGERLAFVEGRVEVIAYIALGILATAIFTLISLVYSIYKFPRPKEIESNFKKLEAELALEREKRISLERLIEELKKQIPKGAL